MPYGGSLTRCRPAAAAEWDLHGRSFSRCFRAHARPGPRGLRNPGRARDSIEMMPFSSGWLSPSRTWRRNSGRSCSNRITWWAGETFPGSARHAWRGAPRPGRACASAHAPYRPNRGRLLSRTRPRGGQVGDLGAPELVFARKAMDVKARAADPLAFHDGRPMPRVGHVPGQIVARLATTEDEHVHTLRLRRDDLLAGALSKPPKYLATSRRESGVCNTLEGRCHPGRHHVRHGKGFARGSGQLLQPDISRK